MEDTYSRSETGLHRDRPEMEKAARPRCLFVEANQKRAMSGKTCDRRGDVPRFNSVLVWSADSALRQGPCQGKRPWAGRLRGWRGQRRDRGVIAPSSFLTPRRIGRGGPFRGSVTSTHSCSPTGRIDGSATCSGMKKATGSSIAVNDWPRRLRNLTWESEALKSASDVPVPC